MSVKAVTWALEQEIGDAIQHLLLVNLANYADQNGYCFPGQELLAKRIGRSTDSVQRHLKKLEARGLISRERRSTDAGFRTSDLYKLHIDVTVGTTPTPPTKSRTKPRKPKPQTAALPKPQINETPKPHHDAALAKPQSYAGAREEPSVTEPSDKTPLPPLPEKKIELRDGTPVLLNGLRSFWLDEFGGDAKCLDLALKQAAAYVQPNGHRTLEVQVSSQLAKIAREKRERDSRYLAAAAANKPAKKTFKPSRW